MVQNGLNWNKTDAIKSKRKKTLPDKKSVHLKKGNDRN